MYVGGNRPSVIHYHNPGTGKKADKGLVGKSGAVIRKDSLDRFAEEKEVFVHAEPIDEVHAKQVIQKAKEFHKNPHQYNGKYNLVTKNCEHFATTCFGEWFSPMKQTTKAVVAIAVVVTTAIATKRTMDKKKV